MRPKGRNDSSACDVPTKGDDFLIETDKVIAAIDRYPPREREQIRKICLDALEQECGLGPGEVAILISKILLAGERILAKKESDARTDPPRRVLVGARVKREFGEKCKRAAQARGISLYAWVCDALERALEAQWMD